METLRAELSGIESELRSLREQQAKARKAKDATVKAHDTNPGDEAYAAAEAASDLLTQIEKQIERLTSNQIDVLKEVGDGEGYGRFKPATLPRIDGWDEASKTLSLQDGDLRYDVSAQSLIRGQATLRPTPPEARNLPVSSPADRGRFLYPVMEQQPFGSAPGDLAATDFVVTFDMTELTGLTGVERAPDAITPKAELSPTITMATVAARQHAVVLDAVPSKIFDTQTALRALLGTEMARRVDQSIDSHVVAKIEAANPPNSESGADLVAKIRNGIKSMHDLGGDPLVLALTPTDAAGLDLLGQPGSGDYLFTTHIAGSGSPVWSLIVREVPGIAAPTLISPQVLGVLYLGTGSVLVDPFKNLETNQVRARVELEATYHIRNAVQGAYVIAA
ncbi:MAG: hypothetical protein ABI726_05070 [bacterium]